MSDITVGSVAVSVVPDARKFREKLAAQLRNLTAEITVTADLARLREQLAEATRARPVTLNVDADTTAAEAQIAAVARDRTATITAKADESALSRIRNSMSGISGAGLAIAALGPALVPVTAAVVGLGAALAAPLAAAGGGLTIFGLIAGLAVKRTNDQIKSIASLKKKVDAAKQSLALTDTAVNASVANSTAAAQRAAQTSLDSARAALASATSPAGRAAAERRIAAAQAALSSRQATIQASADTRRAAAQAKVTAAVAEYNKALDGLTPAQRKFMEAQTRLKSSFDHLIQTVGPVLLGPVIDGMNLISRVLPRLAPLFRPVSKAISELLKSVGDATKGPSFKAFVKAFGTTAADAIVSFGRIFGNVSKGLFNLFRAFGPASTGLVKSIGGMARSFAKFDFGKSKGFRSFLGYVREVGPKVATAFGNLFGALVKIGVVLAPLGALALGLVSGIAGFIAAANPTTLAAIAVAIGAVGLSLLLATGGITGIVPLALALGAGLAYLFTKVKPLNDAFRAVSGWVQNSLLPAFREAGQKVLPALREGFHSVAQSVRDNHGLFEVLGGAVKLLGAAVTNIVIPAVALFYSTYLPLLGKAIATAITAVRLLGVAFATMALVAVEALRFLVSAALSAFSGILHAADAALGWIPGIGDEIHSAKVGFDKFKDGSIKALDETAAKIRGVRDTLNNLEPTKKITVKVRAELAASNRTALALVGLTQENKLNAMLAGRATGGPVVAGQPYIVGEHRPELFVPESNGRIVPEVPSSGGTTGPQFNVETVYAQDVNDFLRQMQVRARQTALGGIPA